MDWPSISFPPSPIITPYSPEAQGFALSTNNAALQPLNNAASASWPTANIAFFYPFRLEEFAVAYQLLFFVGASSAGNIDVGIYDSQKNLIISAGSTAMSATVNTVQELNITDTPLPPGEYLLAGACSSISGTVFSASGADELLLSGAPIYEQASALALPNPCNPVVSTNVAPPRICVGIQTVPTF